MSDPQLLLRGQASLDPGPGQEAARRAPPPARALLPGGPRLPGEGGQPAARAPARGRRRAAPVPGGLPAHDPRGRGVPASLTEPARVAAEAGPGRAGAAPGTFRTGSRVSRSAGTTPSGEMRTRATFGAFPSVRGSILIG